MAIIQKVKVGDEWVKVSSSGKGGGGGVAIEVDNEMSDTSNNAVANKTVKEYIDAMYSRDFNSDFNEEFFI